MDIHDKPILNPPSTNPEIVNLQNEMSMSKQAYKQLANEMVAAYAFHKMLYAKDGSPSDYIFIDVNEAFEELSGFKKEEILGKSALEVLPNAEKYWIETYAQAAETGISAHIENYFCEFEKHLKVNVFSPKKDYFITTFIDTTPKRETPNRLAQTKDFYSDLLETVKEGILVSDKNDIVYYTNTGLTVIAGGNKSDIIGKCILTDFSLNTIGEFKHFYLKAKKNLTPVEYEAKVKTLNNRSTYLAGWLIPSIRDGKYDGMTCSILDVTEQKESKDILRNKEEQFRNIIDHSTNVFYSHTPDHHLTYFSPQVEKILGYKPEEALLKWTHLTSDNPINKIGVEITNRAIETGKVQSPYELELIHKNGSLIRVEVREAPIIKDGKTIAIVGALIDITEQTRIADQLKISEQGLKNLIDKSPVAISINDKAGNINYLNEEFSRVFGYTQNDIKHADEWFPIAYPNAKYRQEIRARWDKELRESLNNDHSQKPFEVSITCKNKQTKFVQIRWAHVGDKILLIFNNLTDQKTLQNQLIEGNLELKSTLSKLRKLNTELEKAKQRAEESDHLKSAFLANMSHEIRTPMNSIIGFSSLLADKELSEAKRERFSELIQTAGEHLLRIINDIIDIAKIESNQLKIEASVFNIADFLNEIYNYHEQSKIRKNSLSVKFNLLQERDHENLHLNTDQVRLKQLLDNLITNALKNTPSGKVEFGINTVDEKSNLITFFVRDTGVGIPPKYKELIFTRFIQVENKLPKDGTGLGLSITKGIISLLGGKIWFESEENMGSTFYFTIPFKPVSKQKEDTPAIEKNIPKNLKGKMIYIAEDDYPSFLFLREILKPTEADIQHLTNGKLLVNAVAEKAPDLILADINMPIMSGIDAVTQIREMGYKGPIIAQTAYAMPEEKERCMQAKCDDYISKPVEIKKMLELIQKHIG